MLTVRAVRIDPFKTGRSKAIAGAIIWIAYTLAESPRAQDNTWTYLLITFAALIILPLLLEVMLAGDRTRLAGWTLALQLPAAILLAVAFHFPAGAIAAFCALPWVALTWMLTVTGLTATLLGGGRRSIGKRCEDAGLIFACVGGLWILADRIGLRPMKFDSAIVALTAAHFHYAGIILPAFTGFVLERYPESRFAARAAVGVVLGVPAVAVGITFSQLGWGNALETAAGCGLALAGMVVAILHVRLALEGGDSEAGNSGRAEFRNSSGTGSRGLPRLLLGTAGVSLFFGMFFAMIYALRLSAIGLPAYDLATMRMLHGTVNAIGFGLCGVLGWRGLLGYVPKR